MADVLRRHIEIILTVLHIIPSISPIRGGPSQAILEMVYALRQSGLDAEIVTTNDNGPKNLDVLLECQIEYQGVPVRFFQRCSNPVHSLHEFSVSYSFTQWLWNNIHQYDLLHIHAIFSYVSTVAMVIARIKKIPYVVRPLGQLCQWSLQQSKLKKQIYLKLVEHANLNHVQAIHFTSIAEYQDALNLDLIVPSCVIPHGLSIIPPHSDAKTKLRQLLQLSNDEPIILFLSRLHPKKGLDILITALARLDQYRYTFVIAGSGDPNYEVEIRQLLTRLGMCDRTHFLGFVEGETKNLLLQGSDLFALTSYSENFGIAVLEALAAGLPALVTPGVALSQLVQQHQFGYVPPLEETAIANAVLQCLQNSEEAKQMGERARKFIQENYTWDTIASDLAEVYQAILANQPLPARLQPTNST